ncbi:transporter substrate-binding domain-containing protein [Litorilituus lipolyticus]|uniref:transporter substrate-binding domain-containing protein n=1 Tax=Litorilituus lipolyticus TaxID=2491017 RepID=UPI001FEB032E|nr:transporter substrate-binding domain-containing protein [Litorilituus lipolyticus]
MNNTLKALLTKLCFHASCLFLLNVLLSANLYAAVPNEKPITIAINATSFPYHSVNSENEPVGLMIDLWRLWAKKQQVDIEFVPLSWNNTLAKVADGTIDIHAGLSVIDERKVFLSYSKPIFSLYTHLYIHQNLSKVSDLNDLKPYTIGVVKGSAHISFLSNHYPELEHKLFQSRPELYNAALKGEILAFTGLEKLAKDFQHYKKLNQLFPAYKRLKYQQGDYAVAVAKGNEGLLNLIEQGLANISQEEREAIERKWLGIEKQKDALQIGVAPNFPPYMALTPSGKPQGLLIDIWRYWSSQTGINIEFIIHDLKEDVKYMRHQNIDVLMAYPQSEHTDIDGVFAEPIYESTAQIYINTVHNRIQNLTQLNQLTNNKIGLVAKSTYKQQVLNAYPNLNIVLFKNTDDMLRAAETHEISAMISLVDLMNAKLIQANLQSEFYVLEAPVFSIKLAPMLHEQNDKLLSMINDGFAELDINQLVKIEKRWLQDGDHYYKKLAQKIHLTPEEKNFIKNNEFIMMGIVDDLSPIEFIDERGEIKGINRDIAKKISERTGLKFNYKTYSSWYLLYQALLNKEVDALGGITQTDERKKHVLFSENYWQMPWVIIHPQHLGKKATLNDFFGKQLAIIKGYYLVDELREKYPLITFVLVDNRNEGLSAIQQDKVDGFIATLASATDLLKRESIVSLMISVMGSVSVDESRFGINPDKPILKDIIDKGILSISAKEKQEIYDKWFSLAINTGLDKKVVLQVGAQIGVLILLVLIVIVMWNRRLQSEIKHREQLEQIMKHMATHDELTGLANRVLLKDRLTKAIEFHQRQSLKVAVLFIDLDGFKTINDIHGHDVGDELLKIVAYRLQGCVRKSDTVVRFGGDEFILLLTGLHGANEAAYVAEKVLELIQKPFELSKEVASIGCSIGIALYPEDGDNESDLLKVADTLMYKVKASGKNHYLFNRNIQESISAQGSTS